MHDIESIPCIKVVGAGGAGINTINRLYDMGVKRAELIAIDLYRQHLEVVRADKKVLMKRPPVRGLICSGCHPWLGEQAAGLSIKTIEGLFRGASLVLIVVGMGGNTGTGAAPVIAQVAREQGAVVVCIATMPFRVERSRAAGAKDNVARLKKKVDTLILIDDNRLLDHVPDLPLEQCFSTIDRLIAETVKSITLSLSVNALVELDLKSFHAVMADGCTAALLVGECKGPNMYEEAAKTALSHSLSDLDHRKATSALFIVTGGPGMTRADAEKVFSSAVAELGLKIPVALGAITDKSYEGKVRSMAILTGIKGNLISDDRK